VLGWYGSTAGTSFTHDGTDFILKNNSGASLNGNIYHDIISQGINTLYINVTDITLTEVGIRVYCDRSGADPSGWTWTTEYYNYPTTGVEEVVASFENITKIRLQNVDITDQDLCKFREGQIIKGEYTLAQLQALGYVSYDPVDLLTCPNNAGTSTVSDTLEQDAQGRIMFTPYVQRNAGYLGYGSPELSTTELITDSEDVNFAGGTIGNWVVNNTGGNGTLAYDGANPSGEKVAKATVGATPGTATGGELPTSATSAFIEGQKYIVEADVYIPSGANNWSQILVGTVSMIWESLENNEANVATEDSWQHISRTFIAGSDVTGAIRIVGLSTNTGDIFYYDNITINGYNIQENLAPVPVDYTPYVIKGNLNQLAEVGQNHQVSSDGLSVYTTHYLGLGASLENIKISILNES
jgi:hypothetical protein